MAVNEAGSLPVHDGEGHAMVPEGQLMAENDSSWTFNGVDLLRGSRPRQMMWCSALGSFMPAFRGMQEYSIMNS
jgi:hypothetical protein